MVGPENVVFIYRKSEASYFPEDYFNKNQFALCYFPCTRNSKALAEAYQDSYNLDDEQLVEIECSGTEILKDYNTFDAEVEAPILAALNSEPLASRNVYIIILGYGIPGGFRDGDDIISSTSRVSRIYHSFNKFEKSYLFDRRSWTGYLGDDSHHAYIVSRLDAPTFDVAYSLITNSEKLRRQLVANGRFYISRDCPTASGYDEDYDEALDSFYDNMFDMTGLLSTTTNDVLGCSGPDQVFPYEVNGSFLWGCMPVHADSTFFHETTDPRIFFYNADNTSADSMRIYDSSWCPHSITAGYAVCAGAMSSTAYEPTSGTGSPSAVSYLPSSPGYLWPEPFFDALFRGATIGEAYLFSCEFYDFPMTLIGDPLLRITFRGDADYITARNRTSNNISYEAFLWDIAYAMGYNFATELELNATLNTILTQGDVQTKLALLSPTNDAVNSFLPSKRGQYFDAVACALKLMYNGVIINKDGSRFTSLDNFLSTYNMRISQLFLDFDTSGESVGSIRILSNGEWMYTFDLSDDTNGFSYYDFEITVSTDDTFNDIVFQGSMTEYPENWYYESRWGEYKPIPIWGLSSAYVGVKTRFISPSSEELTRGVLYYVRIKQWDIKTPSVYHNHDSSIMIST